MLFNSQETSIDPDYARQMLGSWFIASLLSTMWAILLMLYAATCGQVAYYCCHYLPRDNLTVKSLVLLIWSGPNRTTHGHGDVAHSPSFRILDTLTTISDVYNVWSLAILGHGTAFASLMFPKPGMTQLLRPRYMGCLRSLPVASHRSRPIPVDQSGNDGSSDDPVINSPCGCLFIVEITVPACACSAAAADVFICIALSWILYDRKTGFKHILTTTFGLILSGQFFGLKQRSHQVDMTWIAVRCAEGKVHVNSMLAVLNGRHHMREKLMMPQSGLQITTVAYYLEAIEALPYGSVLSKTLFSVQLVAVFLPS
ncbi:hypothetical protein FOMPIDRAFT_115535 [Fomitopsis schrenkii]|uniref:DUF6534 domain-containing protein n=1 Tax=Fomitopsis schrenkii TaxID=2126942 RepID=S8FBB7_FOMSC|nr:hypothetical protein FOMPIDRAFT_115535 [Fomitopsis schrenkii]